MGLPWSPLTSPWLGYCCCLMYTTLFPDRARASLHHLVPRGPHPLADPPIHLRQTTALGHLDWSATHTYRQTTIRLVADRICVLQLKLVSAIHISTHRCVEEYRPKSTRRHRQYISPNKDCLIRRISCRSLLVTRFRRTTVFWLVDIPRRLSLCLPTIHQEYLINHGNTVYFTPS
jgi:hypothetical protein